jgi:hypothetical protein
MRPCLSALAPVIAVASLLVVPAGTAMAQDKIAPTRTYGRDANYGKDFGAVYTNKSKQAPDKSFGLPTAARPNAMPEQQQELVKGSAPPTHPLPNDNASPTTGGNADANASSFGLPDLAPNHEAVPPAAPSANPDFFARTNEFDLPRTTGDTSGEETSMFTTSTPGLGGTDQLQQDAAGPNAAGGQAGTTFGSAAFGTRQDVGNNAAR